MGQYLILEHKGRPVGWMVEAWFVNMETEVQWEHLLFVEGCLRSSVFVEAIAAFPAARNLGIVVGRFAAFGWVVMIIS